jgi:hypothetical protein
MNARNALPLLLAATLAGCAAAGPPVASTTPPGTPPSPLGTPFSDRAIGTSDLGTPLILDRTDVSIGTTVQFDRLPTVSELHDAEQLTGLAHVVLSLAYWPVDIEAMQALGRVPPETDVVVVLPGYPPNRAAAQAWNYVSARLRIVLVVNEPPPSNAVVADLNTMRGLERVIAQLDQPSRTGFERLQRPLGFRKVVP